MSYKSIFTVIIILAVIATLCICIKQPQMHKNVFVYDSQYTIEQPEETLTEQKEIPILEQPATPQIKKTDVETQDFVTVTQTEILQPVKVTKQQTNIDQVQQIKVSNTATVSNKKIQSTPMKVQNNTNITSQKIENTPKQISTSSPQIDLQKIVANNQNIQNRIAGPSNSASPVQQTNQTKIIEKQTTPVSTTKPVTIQQPTKVQQTKSTPEPQKVLTPQEEEIAWNVWRSNLNNKIMQDTNFPQVPPGTVFRYKFNVDKYGKITNVQTWSDTSKYTPYAIQYMAPVIRNLQGRSILNFPQGTARTAVEAGGAWKISTRTKYSNPDDYYDIEKITK